MKALIILSLSIISLNAFSAEVGEEKKSECIYANQSSKREAKVIEQTAKQEIKKEGKGFSK
jgi:hypothetical protein